MLPSALGAQELQVQSLKAELPRFRCKKNSLLLALLARIREPGASSRLRQNETERHVADDEREIQRATLQST